MATGNTRATIPQITVQRLINRSECAMCKQFHTEIDLKVWSFFGTADTATVAHYPNTVLPVAHSQSMFGANV